MGACASKPKDLDLNNQPAPADAPTTPKKEDGVEAKKEDGVEAKKEDGVEAKKEDGVEAKKEDGVETTKEEPLIDISEPANSDTPKVEAERKAIEELVAPVEASKATEDVKEEKKEREVVETVEKPVAQVVAPQS